MELKNTIGKTYETIFNWDIYEYMQKHNNPPPHLKKLTDEASKQEDDDDTFEEPKNRNDPICMLELWLALLSVFDNVRVDHEIDSFQEDLKTLSDFLPEIKNKNLDQEGISSKVVIQLVNSTIYFALKKMNKLTEAEEIKGNFEQINMNDNVEVATLNGCKGLSWYCYKAYNDDTIRMHVLEKSVFYIKQAIAKNENCALWHFMTASNFRKLRKRKGYYNFPKEREHLEKAFHLSQDPFFGVSLAYTYYCSRMLTKSIELYRKISEMDIQNFKIYMRLARGFMYHKDLESAKKWLDKAENLLTEFSAWFVRYKGLYFYDCKNYEEAAEYFKQAGDTHWLRSHLEYLSCLYAINPKQSLVSEFETLMNKYRSKSSKITLKVHLGIHYFKLEDFENALITFHDALSINPDFFLNERHGENKIYSMFPKNGKRIFINDFIRNELLPGFLHKSDISKISPETLRAYNFLNNYVTEKKTYVEAKNNYVTEKKRDHKYETYENWRER